MAAGQICIATTGQPTSSVANANTFSPGMEELGADEMRISFVGSSPMAPGQASMCGLTPGSSSWMSQTS
jgi:hypothetical protein